MLLREVSNKNVQNSNLLLIVIIKLSTKTKGHLKYSKSTIITYSLVSNIRNSTN